MALFFEQTRRCCVTAKLHLSASNDRRSGDAAAARAAALATNVPARAPEEARASLQLLDGIQVVPRGSAPRRPRPRTVGAGPIGLVPTDADDPGEIRVRHSVRLDASLQLRGSSHIRSARYLHRRGGDHEQMNVGVLQSREHETSAEIHGGPAFRAITSAGGGDATDPAPPSLSPPPAAVISPDSTSNSSQEQTSQPPASPRSAAATMAAGPQAKTSADHAHLRIAY